MTSYRHELGESVSRNDRIAFNTAMQLLRGDVIRHKGPHHQGMARLKALFGDPRPSGMYLSLVALDGPSVYWGIAENFSGKGTATLLSRDPDDYAWETPAMNQQRMKDADDWKLERTCVQ